MGVKIEQISKDTLPVPRNSKRYAKRLFSRKNRREAKRDPENAPKRRVYSGWYW